MSKALSTASESASGTVSQMTVIIDCWRRSASTSLRNSLFIDFAHYQIGRDFQDGKRSVRSDLLRKLFRKRVFPSFQLAHAAPEWCQCSSKSSSNSLLNSFALF